MRKAQMIILLGTNGTGKTTLLRRILDNINRRQLIVVPDAMEWTDVPILKKEERKNFSNRRRIIYQEGYIEKLLNIAYDTVLVFDDFKALFIRKQSELNALRSLIIRRRQRKLDIFIVAHGFTEVVPSYLLTFADKFILFRTLDNPYRVKDRFQNYNIIEQAQKKVNQKASIDKHYFQVIKFSETI